MLFIAWNQIGKEHACVQFKSNLTWQIEANCMLFIAWNRVESEHLSKDKLQFKPNLTSWGQLHVVHGCNQIERKHSSTWSSSNQNFPS